MSTEADSIYERSQQPRRATTDAGTFEQHSLDDQIKAAKFKQSTDATRAKSFGLRFLRAKLSSALGQ